VEDEVAHLRDLDLKGVRARWQSILQWRPPPLGAQIRKQCVSIVSIVNTETHGVHRLMKCDGEKDDRRTAAIKPRGDDNAKLLRKS
jgi:hypothetical protein